MRPSLEDYTHVAAGKVRELYRIDDEHLLLVATDRISAFDYVLDTPIPDKGRVLTAMSWYFFELLAEHGVANHLAGPVDDERIPESVLGRAMVVRALDMAPAECVARGYLTGSGLAEYRVDGTVCGIGLPEGLTEASRLPEPIFTPATKAELGDHDENISFERLAEIVGAGLAERLREATLRIYGIAAEAARERGVLLADTKFEFGVDGDELVLADEVLTPDSSRYWPADGYALGSAQPSFDKQYVRDWLTGPDSGWSKSAGTPPPALPEDVVAATRQRYVEAYERISGRSFADWPGGPTPPVAEKRPHRREHHGRTFVDDYEWLRDKDDPATIAHLEAENAYTDAMTAELAPLREAVFGEIRSRVQETDMSVPVRSGAWWYFSRTIEGKSYAVHCRVPVDRRFVESPADPAGWTPPQVSAGVELPDEELFFDGNAEAEGHDFFSLGALAVSNDGTMLAYSVDTAGDERYTLRFRALGGGTTAAREEIEAREEIPDTAAGVTWSACGRYVFYLTVDEAWRPDTVWRHELGTDRTQDAKIFHEPDESYWLGFGETRSERYLVLSMGSKITTEIWLLDAADPTGEPWCVRPREEGVEYDVEHAVVGGRDRLIVTHNSPVDGAPTPNSVVAEGPVAPIGEFSELRVLVPHSDDVRLDGVDAFAGVLALSYRENALPRFALMPLDGEGEQGAEGGDGYSEFRPVDFDAELYTSGLGANPEWAQPVLRVGFGSFVTPAQVLALDVATGELTLLREQEVLGGYDRTGYVERRDWARAPDGTQVPISLVMSQATAARVDDGEAAPCLLYAYGSYESSIDPGFSVARLSLLDRGMVFAVAHVRGGGELGRLWYEDGKGLAKRNTFTDFLACADHLLDTGVTTRAQLVAEGGSAGGLLMGAVANLGGDRFAGIQAVVPFVDPLTSILMPELPLTVIEWDEWGDPLHSPEVYDYMAGYSPYENVEAKPYPAILAITSLNDTRVLYVEPAKWVARLREVAGDVPGTGPVLLQCEMSAGHGGVSGRYESWRQTAFEYAWTLRTAGAA